MPLWTRPAKMEKGLKPFFKPENQPEPVRFDPL